MNQLIVALSCKDCEGTRVYWTPEVGTWTIETFWKILCKKNYCHEGLKKVAKNIGVLYHIKDK